LSKREKTVTRSFRISQSAFKALEEDAARRKISLNTLVNQLLLAHANMGKFQDKLGAIRIARPSFTQLLNVCSDEALIEVGRSLALDSSRAQMLAKYGALSLSTVLDYVRTTAAYGGWGEYSEVESQGKLIITLTHNLGRKGSVFMSSILESTFGMVNAHPKLSSSEHSVTIEI
jgi:predicted DNA-binding ribbon-helix-helix protein